MASTRLLTLMGLTLATLANTTELELLISSEVRGAVYPVDAFSTECDAETYQNEACDCYGGAARRVEAFEGRGDAVAVDTGAHFFGSGLFFNSFQGAAGAEFFAASKYDAWTLHFYDFSAADAADLPDDPTGGKWLAALIDSVRAADPDLGNPVATNLNVTGDPRRSRADNSSKIPTPPPHDY